MVLGKLPVPGRPTNWNSVGQVPTVLAVGADGGCLDIFLSSFISFFFLFPSLYDRLKYCLRYRLKYLYLRASDS